MPDALPRAWPACGWRGRAACQHPRADLSSRVQIVRVVGINGRVRVGHCQHSRWLQAEGTGSLVGCLVDSEDAGAWHKGKPRG